MLLDAPESWVVATLFKTSDKPFDSLLKSLAQAIEGIGVSKAAVTRRVRAISAANVDSLMKAVERVAALLSGKAIVLLIDNLDRYLDDGKEQSERLFELLRSVISLQSVYLIGVLRSDKIRRAVEVLDAASGWHSWNLIPQDPTNLILQLNSLLGKKGYDYDPSLIQELYNSLGGSTQAWPLVGCCLHTLWAKAEHKQMAFRSPRGKSEIVNDLIRPIIDNAKRMLGTRVEQFLRFLALEGISYLEGSKIVWRPILWARVPPEFRPTMEFLVEKSLFATGVGGPAEEPIVEIVPAVIERFWPNARIIGYAKESEELREAKRAANQWKMMDCQLDWLIHRGNRLSRVNTLLSQLSMTDPVLNTYLSECEKVFCQSLPPTRRRPAEPPQM